MPTAFNIRSQITSQIVAALEAGVPPWRKPWKNDPCCGSPLNAITKRPYRGVNVLLLNLSGHGSRYFATFKQWNQLGGRVKRGAKATKVLFYREYVEQVTSAEGEEEEQKRLALQNHCVFNIDQVDGDHLDEYRVGHFIPDSDEPDTRFDDADEVIAATDADIRFGGSRAFYSPSHDFIQIPNRKQFESQGAYYETLFHELVHWSESRREWTGSYELGELIAEIGSCFLSSELGLPHGESLENHASYLQSWLRAMKEDSNFIFRASSAASNAVEFLLSFSRVPQSQISTGK